MAKKSTNNHKPNIFDILSNKLNTAIDFVNYVIDPKKYGLHILKVLGVVLLCILCSNYQLRKDKNYYEEQIDILKTDYEAQINDVIDQAESGIYTTMHLLDNYEDDVYVLAQLLTKWEDMYPGLTSEARTMACWCILNRVDSDDYPDRVRDVVEQPYQFDEYDARYYFTEENVNIATNQIAKWSNGDTHLVPKGAIYMTVSSSGVELRDTFEETSYTNHWRA